jgi:hypothetical protein
MPAEIGSARVATRETLKCPACGEDFATETISHAPPFTSPSHEATDSHPLGLRPYPGSDTEEGVRVEERFQSYWRRSFIVGLLGAACWLYSFSAGALVFQAPFDWWRFQGIGYLALPGLILAGVTLWKRRTVMQEKEPWRIESHIHSWLRLGQIGACLAILSAGALVVLECLAFFTPKP